MKTSADEQTSQATHWPLTLTGGVVSLLNMLLPLVLVRVLDRPAMGTYKAYFLYMALIPWVFLTAGIGNGLSHWAGYDAKRRLESTRASWSALMALSTVCLTIGLLFQHQIASFLGWSILQCRMLMAGGLMLMISGFFEEAAVSWGAVRRGAWFSSGFDLTRTVSMAYAAWRFRSIEAVFIAHVCVLAVKFSVGVFWGHRLGFQRLVFDKKVLVPVLKYAMPVSLAAAVSVATSYSDQILLSRWMGPGDFALYSFGCLLVPPLMIFEQSVNRVLIPQLSKAFVEGRTADARRKYKDATAELAWLHIPAAIGLAMFAEPVVELLYTSQYQGSAVFLRLYALNYFFNHLPYDALDRARARGGAILMRLTFFACVTPVLVFTLLRLNGPAGAMLGAVLGNALMRWSSIVTNARIEGWAPWSVLPFRLWLGYGAAATIAAAAAYLVREGCRGDQMWLLCGGLVFFAVYMGLTWVSKKNKYSMLIKNPLL